MNDSTPSQPEPEHEHDLANASREEIMAALFANMVIQQTNMAMMLLGKVAHPETGKIIHDVEAAKMFIDQLEMLEVKTKGNLSKPEENLLKQALAALHMEFVNAVDGSGTASEAVAEPETAKTEAPPQRTVTPSAESAPEASAEKGAETDDSRKRFSKKY
jgi:hypothetical protein